MIGYLTSYDDEETHKFKDDIVSLLKMKDLSLTIAQPYNANCLRSMWYFTF